MSGDRVTNVDLRDAIDGAKETLREEAKHEHFKTRLMVGLVGLISGGTKALALVGVIHLPHL